MTAYDIAIAGNGIIACSTAFALLERQPRLRIALIGPRGRPGAASAAAGAMLALYAELEKGYLDDRVNRGKFELARQASVDWPGWLAAITQRLPKDRQFNIAYGTTVILNAGADDLDDESFNAILAGLREYQEPHEELQPVDIPGLDAAPHARPMRAVNIPGEGYFPAARLFEALDTLFASDDRVTFIDSEAAEIAVSGNRVTGIVLTDGTTVAAGQVLLAAGARSQILIDKLEELKRRIPRLFYGVGAAVLLHHHGRAPQQCVRTPNRGLACGIHSVPYDDNRTYVGASNFISPEPEYQVRLTSLYSIIQGAIEQIQAEFYKARLDEVKLGFRPTSADTYPLIGATSVDGLFILSGTKRDGIHMSPVYARSMAQAMLDGTECFDGAFRPERRLIRTMSREDGIRKAVRHMHSAAYQHEFRMPKAGWGPMVEDMFRRKVEEVYDRCGITDYGIPPEMLDMYRYGHVQETAA